MIEMEWPQLSLNYLILMRKVGGITKPLGVFPGVSF